jgi:hypothetical protein
MASTVIRLSIEILRSTVKPKEKGAGKRSPDDVNSTIGADGRDVGGQ